MVPDLAPDTTGPPLTSQEGRALLDLALDAIATVLQHGEAVLPDPDALAGRLAQPGASFVTLERDGALLGCIGALQAERALGVDVAAHGVAAAFLDPRLPPIDRRDFEAMSVKVSVLGALEPLAVSSREELAAALVPGHDGLLVDAPSGGATFLPAVWRHAEGDVEWFLTNLWRKAGWRPGAWPAGIRVERYRTTEVADSGPRRFLLDAPPRVASGR